MPPANPAIVNDPFARRLALVYAAFFFTTGWYLPFFPVWLAARGLDPAAIARLSEPWRSASRVPAGVATIRTSWNTARTTPIAAGSSPRAANQTGKNGKYQPVVPKNAA